MTRCNRGAALALALVVLVLVEGFAALGLAAVTARYRLTGDTRLAVESRLMAASVLATARATQVASLTALTDGEHRTLPSSSLGNGWVARSDATRSGSLVRLMVEVERRRSDGGLLAARRVTLLLVRGPADTLRVLRSRARF